MASDYLAFQNNRSSELNIIKKGVHVNTTVIQRIANSPVTWYNISTVLRPSPTAFSANENDKPLEN